MKKQITKPESLIEQSSAAPAEESTPTEITVEEPVEWKQIEDTNCEMDSRGAIRKIVGKSPIFTDSNHNIMLKRQSGQWDKFNSTELAEKLFGRKIPATGNERDNSTKKITSNNNSTMKTTKSNGKKATAKKAEPKAEFKITAEMTKIIKSTGTKSSKMKPLHKLGMPNSLIAKQLGTNPSFVYNIVNDVYKKAAAEKKK